MPGILKQKRINLVKIVHKSRKVYIGSLHFWRSSYLGSISNTSSATLHNIEKF